jgi:protoporphyrinogen oxidase
MKKIHERLYHQTGLHLAGNYLTGVGMKDAVGSGKKVAERLAYLLGNRSSPTE